MAQKLKNIDPKSVWTPLLHPRNPHGRRRKSALVSLVLKTSSVMCTHVHTRESSDETSSAYDHVNETRDAYLCVTVLLRLSEMCRCFPVHRKQRKACNNNIDLPGQKKALGLGRWFSSYHACHTSMTTGVCIPECLKMWGCHGVWLVFPGLDSEDREIPRANWLRGRALSLSKKPWLHE